ncbi:MAG: glycoside hydrolase family 5 protein [Kiritimatiellia bacterium]
MSKIIFVLMVMLVGVASGAYRRGALLAEYRFASADRAQYAAPEQSGCVEWVEGGGKAGDGALRFRSGSKATSAIFSIGLDAAPFRGRIVQAEADMKGVRVAAGDHPWNGPKFMFPNRNERGMDYPEAPKEFGTYDWKTVTAVLAFSTQTEGLRLVLGLEAAPGELWVDAVRFYEAELTDDEVVVAPRNEKAAAIPRGPWRGRHNPQARRGVMSGGDMSEAAFATLAQWNANLIRLQIGIETKAQATLADWFAALEAKLDWAEEILLRCRRYGIKAVIDLHGGPGTIATKHASSVIPEDYDVEPLREAWRRIVRRLKDYPEVYGYDILNEPSANLAQWDGIFLDVTREIRKLDRKNPVITEFCHRYFEGENVVYSPHFYSPLSYTHAGVVNTGGVRWSYPGYIDGIYWDAEQMRVDLEPWIRFSLAHPEARILVGEFSAIVWAKGAAEYIRDAIAVFEEYGWDWTYHAFREWPAWDVEYTHVGDYELRRWQPATADTERKRELLKGLAYNRRPAD